MEPKLKSWPEKPALRNAKCLNSQQLPISHEYRTMFRMFFGR